MRIPFAVLGSLALAMAIVGCGTASPGSSGTPGATLAPGATATLPPQTTPAPTAPGATGGTGLTGHECDAIPTFSISNPNPPSIPPDTTLAAHFPATIDGQPVTDVTTQNWLYYVCTYEGQAGLGTAFGQYGSLNLTGLSWGSATATVDGDSVKINAYRIAGGDSNAMVQYVATLAALAGGTINTSNFAQSNIGGKNVYVATDPSDGSKSYAYSSGDTLIYFDNVTDSQATKILSALP